MQVEQLIHNVSLHIQIRKMFGLSVFPNTSDNVAMHQVK